MIFLDTHTALFLAGDKKKIPKRVHRYLESDELVLSPMARLEFDVLHEIGRLKVEPAVLMEQLRQEQDVWIETEGWARAAEIAQVLSWTRDPFDRLIAAHAMARSAPLMTRDALILEHYSLAFWEEPPTVPSI